MKNIKADDTYSGWSNRATWAMACHITSDRSLDRHRHELCKQALASDYELLKPNRVLARLLEVWITGVAERVNCDRQSNIRFAKLLVDIAGMGRKHRKSEQALAANHDWLAPDQVLALSLEAWAIALSESLLQEEKKTSPLVRMFEDIGPLSSVNWLEVADTFLAEQA